MWCEVWRGRRLLGGKKKFSQRKTHILCYCSKGTLGGVGCQQPWGCISEDWAPVMDTQYRHLPHSPLTYFPMAAELTGWHIHRVSHRLFDATCSLEACQPAQPIQDTGKHSHHAGIYARLKKVSENLSAVMRARVTLVSILGNLSQTLSSHGLYWQEKRDQKANLFFSLVIESGTHCYQNAIHFKHFRGKLLVPASITVMQWAMFGPARMLYDEKTNHRSRRLDILKISLDSFHCKLRVPVQNLADC